MADPPRHAKPKPPVGDDPAPGDPLGYFGAATFDDADFDAGAPLDLSLRESEHPPEEESHAPAKRPHATSPHSAHGAAPADPELSDIEVRLVADYGPAPTAWYLTPRYAWRVRTRQRELRRRVAALSVELDQAESARDEALALLAADLRTAAESDERYADLLEPVRRIETLMGEQSATLASMSAEREAKLRHIDAEREPIETQLLERRQAAEVQAARLAEAERNHARAEARLKRLHIEMRALHETAQRAVGPEGGKMLPEHHAALAELTSKIDAFKPEVAQLAAHLAKARDEHTDLTNQVDHLNAALGSLDARHRSLDADYQKRIGSQSAGVAQVQHARIRALAKVGLALLRRARELGVYPERVAAVEAHEATLAKALHEHARHLAALDSYDADAVRRGLVIAGVAVVIVVVLLWRLF